MQGSIWFYEARVVWDGGLTGQGEFRPYYHFPYVFGFFVGNKRWVWEDFPELFIALDVPPVFVDCSFQVAVVDRWVVGSAKNHR